MPRIAIPLMIVAAMLPGCQPPGQDAGSPDAKMFWEQPARHHPPTTDIDVVVLRAHPRLVFRPADSRGPGRTFDDVRKLYASDATFKAIFDKALALEPGKHHPAAEAACWIVSGDERYAASAIETMLSGTLSKSHEPYYSQIWSYALAYDWLYSHPKMTAEARQVIEDKMLERLGTELDDLDDSGVALWHGRTQETHGLVVAALAMADLPRARPLVKRTMAHYLETLRAFQYSQGWPEGASYWIYNRAGPLALAGDCYITATGDDKLANVSVRDVMRNIGLWSIYSYGPNGVFEPYGDSSGSLHLGDTGWWVLSVDHYAKLSRDERVAAGADWLRNRSPNPYGRRSYHWWSALSYDPSARPKGDGYDAAKPELWMRRHMPQAMLFGRDSMGVAFFRGRWGDPDETFASFKAGDLLAHHDHYDTGNFTLQRGGSLVPQTGFYGDYTSEHRLGYQVQTVSANSLLVMAPGERSGYLNWKHPDKAWLSGGQRVIRPTSFICVSVEHFKEMLDSGPHLDRATITAWRSEPQKFDYVAADITAAYNSTKWSEPGSEAKVSLVTRQFLYLRPLEAFVIYDRVQTTKPDYLPKFVMHANSKPLSENESLIQGQAINGILDTADRSLETEADRGRLTQRVLLPEEMRALKIGGRDYCFYAELDGDPSDGMDGKNLVQGSGRNGGERKVDQWRVEVEPTIASESTRFLNVLLPRLKSDSAALPPVHQVDVGADADAVRVGDTVVVFSRQPGPLVAVTAPTQLNGTCLILNAEPDATYRLGGRTIRADGEGILVIENTPSGVALVEKVEQGR